MKKAKTLPKLKAELQSVFNLFIRLRDKDEPCISCGQFKTEWNAGHFFPVGGYDGLRFDEDNCHKECVKDNCFNEAHLIFYAENLKQRIGIERFEALKQRAAEYKRNGYKWSRYELIENIEYYKQKIKDLQNNY